MPKCGDSTKEGKTASLFGIKSCSSNLEMWEICFGSESKFGLGDWVTVVQRVSVSGLGLLSISLLIQVVHLFLKQRNKAMQAVSLLAVANGGLLLMVAGHIAHNRTVWADDLKNADGSIILKVSPLSGGLMLLGVVMSGAICVLSHVASHSPGPLSTNTRFHLSYDTGSGDDIVPTHQLRLDEITCQDDVTRRTSQRSTEI